MKYVFGPVPSRRLGNSLGVDLVTLKACTFDCAYCQLGRTTEQTTERRRFVPADEVIAEVQEALASDAAVDYVTLSGSGEPTLSLDLGKVIGAIKGFTTVPVAVLTNGSLLWREDVRADLAEANLVVPSLDAGTQATFERVNRPAQMSLETVARGICDFTLGFGGQVWLEVMIVGGVNDTPEEAAAMVRVLEGARIDRVQLNTVVRAPAEPWAEPVRDERLAELAKALEGLAPVEIIGRYARRGHARYRGDVDDAILATLARRPCAVAELAASLGFAPALVVKHIEDLEERGRVERAVVAGTTQFRLHSP
jgi:wyosine [tRNA(Phe)-imidazoG37] synthetase (radical SAM superfamily)